jgi:hypothetical protein
MLDATNGPVDSESTPSPGDSAEPATVHRDVVGQDTALSPLEPATLSAAHVFPRLLVRSTVPKPVVVPTPAATQSVVVLHETAKRMPTPAGTFSDFQVAPPFVVATIAPVPAK